LNNTKGNTTHYFHSGAVMSTVGMGPKLVIGFEMYKPGQDAAAKDEGELSVGRRLISSVVKSHRKLIDVVVYDALACNSIWINHCKNLGIDAIVRAKNNNNNSLRLARKTANKTEAVEVWEVEKGFEKVEVYESTFIMDNVGQPGKHIAVVKRLDRKQGNFSPRFLSIAARKGSSLLKNYSSLRTNEFSHQRKIFSSIDCTKAIHEIACELFDELWKANLLDIWEYALFTRLF
jgi:hypothetical protein